MTFLHLAFVLLVAVTKLYVFTCPEDGTSVYHAYVGTGCQVYQLCHNSTMHIMVCPDGQAFDVEINQCVDASVVNCGEDRHHKYNQSDDISSTITPAVKKTTQQVTPTVSGGLTTEYITSNTAPLIKENIPNDIKPAQRLNSYSSKTDHSIRVKRNAGGNLGEVSEMLFQYTLADRFLLPIISEIMKDPETALDIKKIFVAARAAYAPLVKYTEFASYPQAEVEKAKNTFIAESKPMIRNIVDKHQLTMLRCYSENLSIILGMIDRLKMSSGAQIKNNLVRFMMKHGAVLRSSGSSRIDSYKLAVIKRDFQSTETLMSQLFSRYLSQYPGSVTKVIFNRLVYTMILGEKPLYAFPKEYSDRIAKY